VAADEAAITAVRTEHEAAFNQSDIEPAMTAPPFTRCPFARCQRGAGSAFHTEAGIFELTAADCGLGVLAAL
jgi:hypothetical protein